MITSTNVFHVTIVSYSLVEVSGSVGKKKGTFVLLLKSTGFPQPPGDRVEIIICESRLAMRCDRMN